MNNVIQSQRDWKDFKSNNRVGIIATLFTEQFLKENFETFDLTPDNFTEEIELNGIDTVFIDNDLFESDHKWYRKNRGHIINYLKNKDKNICVVKNTMEDVAQIFKKAFILEVVPELTDYQYSGMVLQVPLQINTNLFNPINATQKIDITHFHIGQSEPIINKEKYNIDRELVSKVISTSKVNRSSLEKLLEIIKDSKVLYVHKTEKLDMLTLQYIEKIASLNATFVIYDHKFSSNLDINDGVALRATNSKISILLKNPRHALKLSLGKQRKVLKENTLLLNQSFVKFLLSNSSSNPSVPQVSIITSTNRKEYLDTYFNQINIQKNVELEVNVVTHGFELLDKEIQYYIDKCIFPVKFMCADSDETLGACLNKCVDESSYPVIAKIDDDDYYLDNYIIDQWLALTYSQSDVVGKSESFYYFEADDLIAVRKKGHHLEFDDFIMGATIMIKSNMLKRLKFADIPKAVDTNLLRRVKEENGIIYVGHPFEMCVFRSKDNNKHTWQVNDLAMLKNADIVGYGAPIPYVRVD